MTSHRTDIDEKWTETGKRVFEEIDSPTRSCAKCQKCDVCVLYRSEIQMLNTYYGHIEDKEQWPCLPEDRAVKCRKYLPMHWQEIAR